MPANVEVLRMLRGAGALALTVLAAGCLGAKSDPEKSRLRDRLSEVQNENESLLLRVAELEKQLEEAQLARQPSRPPSEPARLPSHLRNLAQDLARTKTELKQARTTIELLEEKIAVKDAMLTGSKVNIDKAVREQIDKMYMRSVSSDKAAEVAQKRVLQLRAQLEDAEEDLRRAREMIARLRGARPREKPGVKRDTTENPRF